MFGRTSASQTQAMAIRDDTVIDARASDASSSPHRHRIVMALVVSILATIAMAVPLGYQAYDARHGTGARSGIQATSTTTSPTTSLATTPTTSVAPSTVASSVPSRVLPERLERSRGEITWANAAGAPSRPLDGATVSGTVVVEFAALAKEPTVIRTEFWVDPVKDLPPGQIDTEAPFTMSNDVTVGTTTVATTTVEPSASATTDPEFDTTRLSDGVHNVTVQATQSDGTTISRYCEFRVANG